MDFPSLDLCEITVSSTQTACSVLWICYQWKLLTVIVTVIVTELFHIMHRTEAWTSFSCWTSPWHPLHIRNEEASQLELWPFKQTWAFFQPACKLNASEHQIIFVLHIVEQGCRRQSRAGCGPALSYLCSDIYNWRAKIAAATAAWSAVHCYHQQSEQTRVGKLQDPISASLADPIQEWGSAEP